MGIPAALLIAASCMSVRAGVEVSPSGNLFDNTVLMTAEPVIAEPSGADFGLTGDWIQTNLEDKNNAFVEVRRYQADTTLYACRITRRSSQYVVPFSAMRLGEKLATLLVQHEFQREGRDLLYFYSYAVVEKGKWQEWVILASGVVDVLANENVPHWAVNEDSVTVVSADPVRLLQVFREHVGDLATFEAVYQRAPESKPAGQ